MTTDDYKILYRSQGIKLPDFNFRISYFDCPDSLINMESVDNIQYVFPSVRACVAYMESFRPGFPYYNIYVVNDPVYCPVAFMYIK